MNKDQIDTLIKNSLDSLDRIKSNLVDASLYASTSKEQNLLIAHLHDINTSLNEIAEKTHIFAHDEISEDYEKYLSNSKKIINTFGKYLLMMQLNELASKNNLN
jgi:hypothetical protein